MELKDRKTKITFHNGNKSIGGTLIEVRFYKDRIFFDMGSKFNKILMKSAVKLQELFDLNLANFVPGLFDRRINLKENNEMDEFNTGVFISHCHLDHTNMINFVDSSIPVYASTQTQKLLYALNSTGDFLIRNDLEKEDFTREITGVEFNKSVSVGQIKVKILPVDHDAYGASAFIIETPDTKIAYTGDIRFHGYRPEDSVAFCQEAAGADFLIMEGVSISFNEVDDEIVTCSEKQVINELEDVIKSSDGKNLSFNYYIANIERIKNIIEKCSRTVVLNAFASKVVKDILNIETYYYCLDGKDYGLSKDREIDFSILLKDKEKYLWQNEGKSLDYLDKLEESSIYVHSDAAPLGDFDPNYLPFVNKFSANKIELKHILCSGHATPKDLFKIIELIKPKNLVPFHSFRPEKLYNNFGETFLPEEKETI